MWVRFVLVPGLTDAWDNVEKVADICAGLKSLQRVEILRFHQMGKRQMGASSASTIRWPMSSRRAPNCANACAASSAVAA